MNLTKNKKPRKGKATITEHRLRLRNQFWLPVKQQLQEHLKTSLKGEAARMADFLGIEKSQIHRYSCPVCEHDQEPSYSVGAAIMLYLEHRRRYPIIELKFRKR